MFIMFFQPHEKCFGTWGVYFYEKVIGGILSLTKAFSNSEKIFVWLEGLRFSVNLNAINITPPTPPQNK